MKDTKPKKTKSSKIQGKKIKETKINLKFSKDRFSVDNCGFDIKFTVSKEERKWVTRIFKGEALIDAPIPSFSDPWITNSFRDKKIIKALLTGGFEEDKARELLRTIIIKLDENKEMWLKKSKPKAREEAIKIQKDLEEIKPYRKEALKILKGENPLEYIVTAISKRHKGDSHLLCALGLSLPILLVRGHGNRYITGPSEKGKSDACDEIGKILPKRIYEPLIGSSAKSKIYALLADPDALQNKIFYYDDTRNDDPEFRRLIRIIKDLEPGEVKFYETVLDLQYVRIKITGNCCVWESAVELPSDKQDYSRALICKVEESEEHIKEIDSKCRELEGEDTHNSLPEEYHVCKAIYFIVMERDVPGVVVPYWKKISGVTGGRANKLFMGLIKGHAILSCYQRGRTKANKVIANEEDFEVAKQIFLHFTPVKNLTEKEKQVLELLPSSDDPLMSDIDIQYISMVLDLSYSRASGILKGLEKKNFASFKQDSEKYRHKLWFKFKVEDRQIWLHEESKKESPGEKSGD